MKEIKLTQNKVALIDDEDYEYLNQFKWYANKVRNTFYAKRGRNKTAQQMHRIIMNPPTNMQIDHKDHNGLNNQKFNLRLCTNSQNRMNSIPYGKSKYLGVSIFRGKIPRAQIKVNNKIIYLGQFKTEEAAAREYDEMAKIYHKEFANLNFK
jgi:hypothetical protein